MISLEGIIALAFLLDLAIGDPGALPHPVRWIGTLANVIEGPLRSFFKRQKIAGFTAATLVIAITWLFTWGALRLAGELHPLLEDLVSVLIIYWGLASRDLWDHCSAVFEELQRGDLECARKKVGMICGRDTGELDEEEIARATVESSGENLVDGVIAPIFYAALGGPVAIMVYKAISTLDSTFGYKNEKYRDFGWASARIDDIAARIPARLSGVVVPLAAGILGFNMSGSIRIFLRDRLKHSSPNAGHSEAAFAGALNVQLGGASHYGGIASMKPFIGDPIERISPEKVNEANKLMLVSSILFLAMALLARFALYYSIDYLAAFHLNGAIIG